MKMFDHHDRPTPWFQESGYLRRVAALETAFLSGAWNRHRNPGHDGRYQPKPSNLRLRPSITLLKDPVRKAMSAGRRVSRGIISWWRYRSTVRSLMTLNDYLLKDIGLSRGEIPAVARRNRLTASSPQRPLARIRAIPAERPASNDSSFESAA